MSTGQVTPLSREERQDLRRLLEELSPLNHRIITAHFLLGESVEDIAAQHGLNKEVVRQRISRSLKQLRKTASKQEPRAGRVE